MDLTNFSLSQKDLEFTRKHDEIIYQKFVEEYFSSVENFTKQELAKIIKQIIESSDVETKIYVSHKDPLSEGRAVYYVPFREKNKLENRIEGLEKSLAQALRQWKMYAEDHEIDLEKDNHTEAVFYQDCIKVLKNK